MLPWTERSPRSPTFLRSTTTSKYLVMRDGAQIAIDLTLPVGAPAPVPTILRQTRYHRRMVLLPPFNQPALRPLFDQQFHARRYFVSRGYAWVDVCVRGSGASSGRRPMPWGPDERADGLEILNWIAEQSWSNGRIGARGISYDGTAAEFLMWHGHPALRAVAPRFSLFDVFEDIAMPGGIHLNGFTRNWGRFNDALDRNRFDDVLKLIFHLSSEARAQLAASDYGTRSDRIGSRLLNYHRPVTRVIESFVRGVAATDDDPGGHQLAAHLGSREPALDVHEAGNRMTFRDDRGLSDTDPELSVDDFSPHAMLDALPSSLPVYHYTGWMDGAYQRAAMKRFASLDDPGQRMIIGPWEHGGRQDISPWNGRRDSDFDHEAELLRFFDAHLRDDADARADWYASPRVRYFTMGAERWSTADRWPPAGFVPRRYHLGAGTLGAGSPGQGVFPVTGQHGTGEASRWRSLLPMLTLTHYPPRRGEVLTFDTASLERDLEVTGHPLVHIELRSTTSDPRLFAYLEDVEPAGTAHYVTEGQFRAVHRRKKRSVPASHAALPFRSFRRRDGQPVEAGSTIVFEFDLLPTSFVFRRGHRLRLVLAGADADNFDVGPHGVHTVDYGNSWIEVPVPQT